MVKLNSYMIKYLEGKYKRANESRIGLEKPIDVAINVGFNEIKYGVHAIIG